MGFAGISLRFQLLIRTVTDSNVGHSFNLGVMWGYGAWNHLRMRADTRTDKKHCLSPVSERPDFKLSRPVRADVSSHKLHSRR